MRLRQRKTGCWPAGWSAPAYALALLLAGPVFAHDFWIEPSRFTPGAGIAVAIDLKVGEEFVGDSVPRRTRTTDRFELYAGDDAPQPISGADGLSPAGTIVADGGRTMLIAYSGAGGTVTLPADRFSSYLESHGLEWVIRERATRSEAKEPGRENFYRHAKILLGGAVADPSLGSKALGQTLEILVDGDPTQDRAPLVTGRVLWHGHPLVGGLLIARASADPRHPQNVRTDTQGRFSLTVDHGGIWLLQIVWMERAGWFSSEDWQSHWSSLTFEKPQN
ncbi:DUF4198 domain-containing protein [Rhizobium oryziradicis]|uniref:DUF4198 domain-containing protein n=1 Tax=Rhizobium oryziradicis TaxID=1867956 RepID=A0A1Q8ZWD9_9HYPH|nr:DUF4198 domain-containing protein [Rhizobium oryziradicis]OLP46383.1 hypothetical protein BJF95_04245 [Rhizobium oryziradicis]